MMSYATRVDQARKTRSGNQVAATIAALYRERQATLAKIRDQAADEIRARQKDVRSTTDGHQSGLFPPAESLTIRVSPDDGFSTIPLLGCLREALVSLS
jgi:hypothetical protein